MIARYRGVITRYDTATEIWMVRFSHGNHPFSGKEFIVSSVHEDIVLAEGVEVEFILSPFQTEGDAPIIKAIDVKPMSPFSGPDTAMLSSDASIELENAERDSWLKSIAKEVSERFSDSGGGSSQHRYLQEFLKKIAEEKGWHSVVEKTVENGKIDLFLQKGNLIVGCEISVSTSPQHELGNIKKCLGAECRHVISVSLDTKSATKVRKLAEKHLAPEQLRQVVFLLPEEVSAFLNTVGGEIMEDRGTMKGYRIKVTHGLISREEAKKKQETLNSVLLNSIRKSKQPTAQ